MYFILLYSLAFCVSAHSDSDGGSPSQTGDAHIVQLDSNFPIDKINNPKIHVHSISQRASQEEVLPVNIQKQLLYKAGFTNELKGWAGFDMDRLTLRTENQEPKEVADRYEGTISIVKISKLKVLIQQFRKEQGRR